MGFIRSVYYSNVEKSPDARFIPASANAVNEFFGVIGTLSVTYWNDTEIV